MLNHPTHRWAILPAAVVVYIMWKCIVGVEYPASAIHLHPGYDGIGHHHYLWPLDALLIYGPTANPSDPLALYHIDGFGLMLNVVAWVLMVGVAAYPWYAMWYADRHRASVTERA